MLQTPFFPIKPWLVHSKFKRNLGLFPFLKPPDFNLNNSFETKEKYVYITAVTLFFLKLPQ